MTIEEKAKDFAGYNLPSAQDMVTTAKMSGKYDGFKAGAEWMQSELIEKALEWFKHQKEEIGISWYDDYEIRFRKAMKE